jgi:hypothetical protein
MTDSSERSEPGSAARVVLTGNRKLEIDAKAEAIDSLLWNNCRSPENLLYCFLIGDPPRRITIDDIAATAPDPENLPIGELAYDDDTMEVRWIDGKPQYLLQNIPLEDVEAYEDSLYSTGSYLSALSSRYLATLDPSILQRAHTVFEGLYSVYELGLQDEPGWIPKPYGFQCTKQSSMDNQCNYYHGMLRYYRIAPDADKEKILRVLTDEMDYWIRHRYRMHHHYFGIWVDYTTDEHYPGHWTLLFLPLCDALYRLTGDQKYRKEFDWLLERTRIEPGRDPEFLLSNIRCFHRWYYEFGAMLEQGTEPRELWLDGLRYQIDAIRLMQTRLDPQTEHHAYTWLLPRSEELRDSIRQRLDSCDTKDFLYVWPEGWTVPETLAWRSRAVHTGFPTKWLEVFWSGRLRGDW